MPEFNDSSFTPAGMHLPSGLAHSGTMAQQIALRIWSVRRACPNVAFHPNCHLEIHQQKGYQLLHELHGVLVGEAMRIITLSDLEKLTLPPWGHSKATADKAVVFINRYNLLHKLGGSNPHRHSWTTGGTDECSYA